MTGQQRTMPTAAQVRSHWAAWFLQTHDDVDDSPQTEGDASVSLCYACGYYWPDCERAHIVARCNGGSDSVENLHMLCKTCHRASEPYEGDAYWEWITGWTITHAILARRFAESPGAVAEVVVRSLREMR